MRPDNTTYRKGFKIVRITSPEYLGSNLHAHTQIYRNNSGCSAVHNERCVYRSRNVPLYLISPPPLRFIIFSAGEIIRSELGGHDTPNLVAFKARDRSIGEAAVSMVTSAPTSTVGVVHTMAGTAYRYAFSIQYAVPMRRPLGMP